MPRRFGAGFAFLVLALVVVVSGTSAQTGSNSVPPSRLTHEVRGVYANDLKPPECAALNLTNLVVGNSEMVSGTDGNDLILAGSAAMYVGGLEGDDCLVVAGGMGAADGGGMAARGNDVCIARLGMYEYIGCEQTH